MVGCCGRQREGMGLYEPLVLSLLRFFLLSRNLYKIGVSNKAERKTSVGTKQFALEFRMPSLHQ